MPEVTDPSRRGGFRCCRRCLFAVLQFVVIAGLVFTLPVEAEGFDNVQYRILENPHDNTVDTLGMIALRSEPQLMKPMQVDVEWYRGFSRSDSVVVSAGNGSCNFLWDKAEHVWYGDFGPGDVLRTSFQVTPIQVGQLDIELKLRFSERVSSQISIGFTLDEHGNRIEPISGSRYGELGPSPEAPVPHWNFVHGCYQSTRYARDQSIWSRGKLKVPLGPGHWSTFECVLVPTCDLSQGVFYRIHYDNILEVRLTNPNDWLHYVDSGDSLRVTMQVRPVRPGVGSIALTAIGFNPYTEPSHPRGVDYGGSVTGYLRVDLAVSEDLRAIASSEGPLSGGDDLSDAYRLPAIADLRAYETLPRIISSDNYDSLAVPLRRQYDEARGY